MTNHPSFGGSHLPDVTVVTPVFSAGVDSVLLATAKAGERAQGAVMASDAFFPFPDGVELAAEAGVTAVVQPGGSVRDEQVIDRADRLGLAMCFTGVRHFRH